MHPYRAIEHRKQQRRMNGTAAAIPDRKAVHWDEEETNAVAVAAFELLVADPALSYIEAVKRAQVSVLKTERHRAIKQERDFQYGVMPILKSLKERAASDARISITITAEPASLESAMAEPVLEAVKPESVEPENVDATAHVNAPALADVPAQGDASGTIIEAKEPRRMIRWTHAEQLEIARESKRLRAGFPDMSDLESIRKAVEYKMPSGRQRKINTMTEVRDWIGPLWQQVDAEERARHAEQEMRTIAETVNAETRAQVEAEAEQAKAVFDPSTLSFETLIRAVGAKIGQQVVSAIGEHLQEAIMQRIDDAIRSAPVPVNLPEGVTRLHPAPRDRKPRVVVVGLLNQQARDVEDTMEGMLQLDFIKADTMDVHSIEAKARNADIVVLMTKFISHKHQDVVKRVNDHIVYRNGGPSELKRWLTAWINGEVLTAA